MNDPSAVLPLPSLPRMLRAAILPLLAAALCALALPAAAAAQLRPARMLTAEAAQRAIAAADAEARTNGWNVSIAVVDQAGDLIAFLRRDGAHAGSVDIARGKARTAARFRRPTKSLDSSLMAGRLPILAFEGVTPVEGGVPITVGGEVVGAVGVSGATSAQDAQVAAAGAAAVKP